MLPYNDCRNLIIKQRTYYNLNSYNRIKENISNSVGEHCVLPLVHLNYLPDKSKFESKNTLKNKRGLQQALNIFILSQKFRVVNP